MKIVKLNRRHKQFKEQGHTIALRFDRWDVSVQAYENACKKLYPNAWLRDHEYYIYFGRTRKMGPRPFWITLRYERDLTAILLMVETN